MLDLRNADHLYIDGQLVKGIWIDGNRVFVKDDIVLAADNNFHILLGNRKDVLKKGIVYQADAEPSPKTPNYTGYITVEAPDGETYYINTISTPDEHSSAQYDGKYLSNGWCSYVGKEKDYVIWEGHYTRNFKNKWYFAFTIEPKPSKYPIDNKLIDDAIDRINRSMPIVNIKRGTSTINFLYLDDYEDTWLGLCTSWTDHEEIKLNKRTLDYYGGQYVYDPKAYAYRYWLETTVHEFGHTIGFPDQPTHAPSLYDYNNNRYTVLYLQANDIYYIKDAYKKLYDVDPAIFDREPNSMIDAKNEVTPMMMRAASRVSDSQADNDNCCHNFNFPSFNTPDDLKSKAKNVVIATLTYDRTERLNIGGNLELDYDIYTINVINQEKGTLSKREMKVHPQENNIKENKVYRLYLEEYENTPCSPLDIQPIDETDIREE